MTRDSLIEPFRRFLEAAPDAMLVADTSGNIVLVNTQAERVFGYAHDELDVPAVAVTAHARIEDRDRALSAGFEMYVPKPIEPERLVEVVGRLAHSR